MRAANPSDYHLKELQIALDPESPFHALPKIGPEHRRILDIGCGAGQSLVALKLSPDQESWGVDADETAIELGRKLVPQNVRLVVARGEFLPLRDACFDLVFSRVAAPYMDIPRALEEFSRVLRPGGELWLSLHPPRMLLDRFIAELRNLRPKGLAACTIVGANSLAFNLFGASSAIFGMRETVQTVKGMKRLLEAKDFGEVRREPVRRFVMTARKASTTS